MQKTCRFTDQSQKWINELMVESAVDGVKVLMWLKCSILELILIFCFVLTHLFCVWQKKIKPGSEENHILQTIYILNHFSSFKNIITYVIDIQSWYVVGTKFNSAWKLVVVVIVILLHVSWIVHDTFLFSDPAKLKHGVLGKQSLLILM